MKALQKCVVQIASDTRALRESLVVPEVHSGAHLPEPQTIKAPRQQPERRNARRLERASLPVRGLNFESHHSLAPAPVAVRIAGHHFELVPSRRNICIVDLARSSRLTPGGINGIDPKTVCQCFRT